MKELKLINSSLLAIIDDEDYERISKYNWQLKKGTSGRNSSYIKRYSTTKAEQRKDISLHVFIMGSSEKGITIDHKDRNVFNNQKSNLRRATQSQNSANRIKFKNTKSRYKGVYKQGNKYVAQIRVNYKLLYLGRFLLEKEAVKAYNNAAIIHFGEFAQLNILK